MTNNWFGWIVIAFLTLWLLALIAFTCMSLLVRCVDFNEDGNLVLKRIGRRFRKNVGDRSLVTKEVKDHAFLDDAMCENAVAINVVDDDYSDGGFQRCAICLEPYKMGDIVSWAKHLPNCTHAFHPECIKPWITKHSGCPCCRSQIVDRNDLVVEITCGSKGNEKKQSRMQNRQLIAERRQKGEFCVIHGLVFPPEVQVKEVSDIEENEMSVPLTSIGTSSDRRGFVLAPRARSSEFESNGNDREGLNLPFVDDNSQQSNSSASQRGWFGTNFLNMTPPSSPSSSPRRAYYGPYYVGPVDSSPFRKKGLDDTDDPKDETDDMGSPRGIEDVILE